MIKSISHSRATFLLTCILFLGFLLRVWGISFGLPELVHSDEPIVVNHALSYGLGDFNPHYFKIPPLTSYILFFVYGFYFLFGFFFGQFPHTEAFLSLFLKDPSSFYLLGRLVIGVGFGLASIVMVYRLFRLLFTRQISLLGAFLLSVLFLPVQLSHYIYLDSPLFFMILFSLFFFLRISLNGRFKDYVFAIFATGAAIALKYNAGLLILPFLTAHFLRSFLRSRQSIRWNYFGVPVLCLGGICTVFFLLNPFFLIELPFAIQQIKELTGIAGKPGPWHHIGYSLREGIGIPLLGFSMLAMIGSLFFIRRAPYLIVFYVYTICFYWHLVFYAQSYGRYGILLIPSLLSFAAFFRNHSFARLRVSFASKTLPKRIL